MPSGSMIPRDVREQMEKDAAPRRGGGIGAAAQENEKSARIREQVLDPSKRTEEEPEAVVEGVPEELTVCNRCKAALTSEWNFCAKCGADLIRGGAAKTLGIEFGEQDIEDYLFKGYIHRGLKVLGRFEVVVKSSQPSDIDEIDEYIMTGEWRKKDGKDRPISDFYLQQVNTLCMTAACIVKFDGKSIGNTLKERMDWLFSKGAALVDMLGQRAILFNRAVTDFLKKADTVLGS